MVKNGCFLRFLLGGKSGSAGKAEKRSCQNEDRHFISKAMNPRQVGRTGVQTAMLAFVRPRLKTLLIKAALDLMIMAHRKLGCAPFFHPPAFHVFNSEQ